MMKEMRKATYGSLGIIMLISSMAFAFLVDDFESYQTGNVKEVANPPWHEVNSGTGYADIETYDDNQYLTYGWDSTSGAYVRGAYYDIPAVADTSTEFTLFVRIYAEPGNINHSFGLSDDAVPGTSMSHYEVQIIGSNGANDSEFVLKANDGGNFTSYATLNRGQWYNVWAIVDQSTDTFDIYVTTGETNATEADKVADDVTFRYGTTDDLVTFFAAAYDANQNFRVDDVYIFDSTALFNPSMNLEAAHLPDPLNGDTGVETSRVLTWHTGLDPNGFTQVNPLITHHYLYLTESEPNFISSNTYEVLIPLSGPTETFSLEGENALQLDKTYFWRIDEVLEGSDPKGANVIEGPVWSFETIKSSPVIIDNPVDSLVDSGENVIFNVGISSVSVSSAAWFMYVDGINDIPLTDAEKYYAETDGTSYASLTVKNASVEDEGFYYCILSSAGGQATSSAAALGVKQLKAHWTLDELVEGQYADETGKYPADPNGMPMFVVGANADVTDQGVQVDLENGFASVGSWNPSEYSNQLTISLWAKWAGQLEPPTYQGLLAKRNAWGDENMMWQLEIEDSSGSLSYKNGINNSVDIGGVLPVDQWTHLVISVDNDQVTTYRNGIKIASGTVPFSSNVDANLVIGAVEKTDEGLFNSIFNGALDDIRIYNYAISELDAIDLFYSITGENICILNYASGFDFNNDCIIDLTDFSAFSASWLDCGRYPECY